MRKAATQYFVEVAYFLMCMKVNKMVEIFLWQWLEKVSIDIFIIYIWTVTYSAYQHSEWFRKKEKSGINDSRAKSKKSSYKSRIENGLITDYWVLTKITRQKWFSTGGIEAQHKKLTNQNSWVSCFCNNCYLPLL